MPPPRDTIAVCDGHAGNGHNPGRGNVKDFELVIAVNGQRPDSGPEDLDIVSRRAAHYGA